MTKEYYYAKIFVNIKIQVMTMKKNRKILLLSLALLMTFSFPSCSESSQESEVSQESSKTSVVSQVSEESRQKQIGDMLMNSFAGLWNEGTYYIDYTMTVEYDSSAFSSSTAASEESAENTESSSEITKRVYDIIIAVDGKNQLAGLNMISGDNIVNLFIKDNSCYDLDYTTNTYTVEPYPDEVTEFGKQYTTNICLGIVNNLQLQTTANTQYGNQSAVFERYTVNQSYVSDAVDFGDIMVTYYFQQGGLPLAEEMETSKGRTTFEIHKISNQIENQEILKIPENFKKAE